MKQFIAFVIKETKHILRDKRTMLILFGMPVVMMLLFGFAVTTDVKNVRTVVVTSEMSPRTQQAVERLAQSDYFIITQTVNAPQDAERLIRSQKADMSLTPSPSPSPSPIGEGSRARGVVTFSGKSWLTVATPIWLSNGPHTPKAYCLSQLTANTIHSPRPLERGCGRGSSTIPR